MSPTLSLQIYAEPFVSAGAYTSYKELVDGRADDWQSRYAPYAYARQRRLQLPVLPDHERPALGIPSGLEPLRRLAAGPRGERAAYGDFRFGRDFSGVFSVPASNVFLVKFSYWLNY